MRGKVESQLIHGAYHKLIYGQNKTQSYFLDTYDIRVRVRVSDIYRYIKPRYIFYILSNF